MKFTLVYIDYYLPEPCIQLQRIELDPAESLIPYLEQHQFILTPLGYSPRPGEKILYGCIPDWPLILTPDNSSTDLTQQLGSVMSAGVLAIAFARDLYEKSQPELPFDTLFNQFVTKINSLQTSLH